MILVNMHEAKTRLSELVKAAEGGETIVLCRNGVEVAEIRPRAKSRSNLRNLKPDPALLVKFSGAFDPTELASEDEWPEQFR